MFCNKYNQEFKIESLKIYFHRCIASTLKRWENEKSMVLIRASGGRAFCCGGDMREIHEKMHAGHLKTMFSTVYPMNSRISAYKVPYVAIIDGITMGGGVGLSIHGRYRVATERTVFAMPECAVGLFPDVGASQFLPRMGKELGLFLGLTGWKLTGKLLLQNLRLN
jgi:3-hydroxyisobutyryl-CoA hydrolase